MSTIIKKLLSKIRKQEYPNRFVKFYHLNKERLLKDRKLSYKEKKEKGICVRCSKKAIAGIVFCDYHQQKQKEYNAKARGKSL